MTEIATDTPVMVSGDLPLVQSETAPIEGVYDKVKFNKEVTVDFAENGLVATLKGTTIPELQKAIHEWAVRKEWRGENADLRTTGDDIALIVSECAEALEAFREMGNPNAVWYTYTVEVAGVKFKNMSLDQLSVLLDLDEGEDIYDYIEELNLTPKPEGVGPELADTVIRILDYCEEHNINLLHFLMEKMAHNEGREVRHGGMHL